MKLKRLKQSDVIHKWANQLFPKDEWAESNNGTLSALNESLYYNSTLIAKIVRNNVFISNNFQARGWGGGSSIGIYDIVSAIPDGKYTIYTFDEIPHDYILKDDEVFKSWYRNEFIKFNASNLYGIANKLDFIKSNRRVYHGNVNIKLEYVPLPRFIERGRKRLINSIHIKHNYYDRIYTNWSSYYCINLDIDHTIHKLISYNDKLFITGKQFKEFDFKVWHHKYGIDKNGYRLTKKQSFEIFNNSILKEQHEDNRLEIEAKREEIRLHNILKKNIQSYNKYLNYVDDWKSNDSAHFNFNKYKVFDWDFISQIPTYLKLLKGSVITSQNVKITLNEAKAAYLIFKRYSNIDSDIDLTDKNYKIDGYTIRGIFYKDIVSNVYTNDNNGEPFVIKEIKCLVVGCHTIPEYEIKRFVEYYKLDW